MSDSVALLAFIDRRISAIASRPAMWGSPESVELQMLQLIELRAFALHPGEQRLNRLLRDAYRKYIAANLHDPPNTMLAHALRGVGREDELAGLVAKFCAEWHPAHVQQAHQPQWAKGWLGLLVDAGIALDRPTHETRLFTEAAGANSPAHSATVRRSLDCWEEFYGAAANSNAAELNVLAMAPGSLRVLFSSPAKKQATVLQEYEQLVGFGSDTDSLLEHLHVDNLVADDDVELRPKHTVAGAYFDLVSFLASNGYGLELTSNPTSTTNSRSTTLSYEMAEYHREALGQIASQTRMRDVMARVNSASLTKSSIELAIGGKRYDAHVSSQSKGLLRGLKLGTVYRFVFEEKRVAESPSAPVRIDIDLHSADPEASVDVAKPTVRKPRSQGPVVAWYAKELAATDALRNPGNVRSYVQLTKSVHQIDLATWFRQELFSTADWRLVPRTASEEQAILEDVEVVFLGVSLGSSSFKISHDPKRGRHHHSPSTRFHWNQTLISFLEINDCEGKWLLIERRKSGAFRVLILDEQPSAPAK